MKRLLFIILFPLSCFGQNEIAKEIQALQTQEVFKTEKIFEVAHVYDRQTRERGVRQFTNFKATKPKNKYVRLKVPIGGIEIPVLVYKVEMNTNILVSFGSTQKTNNVTHYRGVVENTDDIVALSFFEDGEVFGNLQIEKESYTIAKIGDAQVIYNDKDVQQQVWTCGTVIKQSDLPTASEMRLAMDVMVVNDKCVQWYYETDYDIYLNKGTGTAAYIQAAFNQVQTLHENNGIHINLKTLFVWTTPDPYTGTTAHDYLDQFGDYRTSFDGNLGMLLGYYGGGGVAYVNTLCSVSTRARQGYSAISMSYSAVPTYSWTVEVISHEGGHLLGSPHTHDCAWNGNYTRIDSCGDARGYSSCSQLPQPIRLPVNGGGIMSYCHLTSVGINFADIGFGLQPTALILSKINAASCLGTVCNNEPCHVPAQPGAIQGSTNVAWKSQQVYSVTPVLTATSYTWTIPTSGWTGSSTTNSITTIAGSIGGTITVRANNNCGVSPTTSLAVTVIVCNPPAQPSVIKADNYACMWANDVNVFMVDNVAGVTYNWTVPVGCEVMSGAGTNVLMVKFDTTFKTSSLSVTASNSCGVSAARSLQVVKCVSICAKPRIITCSIVQRTNDVFTNRGGHTNYNYKWWKNGELQGNYQTKIINGKPVEVFVPFADWKYQTVSKKFYTVGDTLDVEVGSTNGQTVRECYITGFCSIQIK